MATTKKDGALRREMNKKVGSGQGNSYGDGEEMAMSVDTPSVQSRRSFMAAAAGAVVAAIAGALGRPGTARASDPNDVVLGATNTSGNTTLIQNTTTANAAFKGKCATGDGVVGESAGNNKSGVYGFTTVNSGYGVFGRNKALGYGVGAEGQTAVWANGTNYGVFAQAVNGNGVWAESQNGSGVRGVTSATTEFGVVGEARDSSGLLALGSLGGGNGVGVHGWSQDGTGVMAESAGTALAVVGKAEFSRSGKVTIAEGSRYIDVDLTSNGGLEGTPLLFANLQQYRQGVHVAAVRPNYPSSDKFRIYLNKAVTIATRVAWQVLG
jgi:hypothetical protein